MIMMIICSSWKPFLLSASRQLLDSLELLTNPGGTFSVSYSQPLAKVMAQSSIFNLLLSIHMLYIQWLIWYMVCVLRSPLLHVWPTFWTPDSISNCQLYSLIDISNSACPKLNFSTPSHMPKPQCSPCQSMTTYFFYLCIDSFDIALNSYIFLTFYIYFIRKF